MKQPLREALYPALDGMPEGVQIPDIAFDPAAIRVLMVNEVVPASPADGFYAGQDATDAASVCALFLEAGFAGCQLMALLEKGIYLTSAVKTPKDGYGIPLEVIKAQLPMLAAEIDMLPNLVAVMLMGDVAKKAFNAYVRGKTGKACIPAGSTYKLRQNEYRYGNVRVFPSYIMTGGNIQIEKSKRRMVAEDIRAMMGLL